MLSHNLIDLTHPISPTTPAWPGSTFELHTDQNAPQSFCIQTYHSSAGFGTHMDAPLHMIPGGRDIASYDINTLCAPCSLFVAQQPVDASFVFTSEMLCAYEQQYGKIATGSWFVLMTGWGKHAHDQKAYQNMDQNGLMHFPNVSAEVAQVLAERKIVGLCIDTLSPDGNDYTFPVHNILLGAGIVIAENIRFYDGAIGNGHMLQVVPLPIVGGAEAPVRVLLKTS